MSAPSARSSSWWCRAFAVTAAPAASPSCTAAHADAARGAVHEQALAGSELRLGEERVVRGREHLDEAARLLPGHPVRDRQHVRLVRDRELRLAAARQERHHAPAVRGLAGAFEPRHVGRTGRRRVAAGALSEVGAVDAGGADADQELAVLGTGSGRSATSIRPSTIVAARI